MPRRLVLALVFACSASAGIWPAHLGKYDLKAADQLHPTDVTPNEYGFDLSEEGNYGNFKVLAERYRDTTGAYAAWLTASKTSIRVGNYVITCTGNCPKNLPELAAAGLPNVSHSPAPILAGYFPSKGMIPHSQRYIVGPVSLRENTPQIPVSAVAFQFGTEGEFALYRAPGGNLALAIFSYPAPQMARQQTPLFEAIPNAVVKRTGPLIAVVLPPATQAGTKSDAAQELLSLVNYGGSVAWNQPMPLIIRPQTMAQILVAIFMLAGVVIGFCVVSGLAFALIRIIARKFGYSDAQGTMTTLHLSGK